MMLFTPEDHPQNPPQSWLIVKSGRRWNLTTKDGDVLESFPTRRAATQATNDGQLVALYEKEGRWYAGENVPGWKPYDPKAPVPIPERMLHNDMGIWRVLEETIPSYWMTLANYATEAEAKAFLDGLRYTISDRSALTKRTYTAALATVKDAKSRSSHAHTVSGQTLRHAHIGGETEHGYFEHAEDAQ